MEGNSSSTGGSGRFGVDSDLTTSGWQGSLEYMFGSDRARRRVGVGFVAHGGTLGLSAGISQTVHMAMMLCDGSDESM
jgi:hypothetical protein